MANRRTRSRRESFRFDRAKIANRIKTFYDNDKRARDVDRDIRLQRYAKFRMWTEGKTWPWDDASDIGLPDMAEQSLRSQDTLHNAVMSQRPPIGAVALSKNDKGKESKVDHLLDFQFFVEQSGETVVAEMAEAFVNDGVYTLFIPWVDEVREISKVKVFPPIPEDQIPAQYFSQLLAVEFPRAQPISTGDGWDFEVEDSRVSFFTTKAGVEMVTREMVKVFDGPNPRCLDYEDVLHPVRAGNLQIKSTSNSLGASHVIIIDYPSVDEVKRLAKSGYYDLISKDDLGKLEDLSEPSDSEYEKEQKDTFAGQHEHEPKQDLAKSHRPLTRLTVFDSYDVDGDGLDEDVVWWMLLEQKIMLKAKLLTEVYPANPPRRPFAEAPFIPVKGRRIGISELELIEGLHDSMKALFDQGIDAGTLANVPFWFYRAGSNVKSETVRLTPGEGYPLSDVNRDVSFPQVGNPAAMGFNINLMTLLGNMEERLTMKGDLQFGRVPAGRATALRTASGLALLSGQGEARPERILRRFFMGIAECWKQMHELNQAFLPKDKQIRIMGSSKPSDDPFMTISGKNEISGRFRFDFSANVLNTSKQALQQSLDSLFAMYVSPLFVQLGLIDADGIYRLGRAVGKARGQDPDQYLTEPSPDAGKPKILAEEAIASIFQNQIPDGVPAEGSVRHLEQLVAFTQTDDMGLLSPQQIDALKVYVQQVQERVQLDQRRAQLAQAAQAQQQGQGQAGRPAEGPPGDLSPPQVSSGAELLDETLPGA